MGCPDDDANAADNVMNKMDEMTPEALILGGISPSDLSHFRLGPMAYVQSALPQLEPLDLQSVIARKRFTHYFQHQVS